MKNNLFVKSILLGCQIMTFTTVVSVVGAQAQSTTSTTSLPSTSANANTAAANVSEFNAPRLGVSYLGNINGPSLELEGAHSTGNAAMYLDNRPKFALKTNENTSFFLESRFNAFFSGNHGKEDRGMHVENANWRLGASFKNVVKTDTFAMNFSPKLILPTSIRAHNQNMLPSPVITTDMDFTPKDSRFAFNLGAEYRYGIFQSEAEESFYASAATSTFLPWVEVTYQLTPKVVPYLSYWPAFYSLARQNVPLSTDAEGGSNEIDLGAYVEVAKGWQVAPYIAFEPHGLDSTRVDKSMQLNLAVIGTIL